MDFGQRGVILRLGEVRSFIRKPYTYLAMKNIDDKMIEQALRNLKQNRKLKSIDTVFGSICLLFAGFLAYILYLYIQKPFPQQPSVQDML
jgi:hypothetical protein